MTAARLEQVLAELDERNVDNVTRTESYLELYAYTVAHPPELPWLLMAHLVSRNGGYLMSDVARALDREGRILSEEALENLFLFLERANFLIFYDAWHHVLHHLLERTGALDEGRTPRYVREAWRRYERAHAVDAAVERGLVFDLVVNEQNYIERRVVQSARFRQARAIVDFVEAIDRERPLVIPFADGPIKVGRFGELARRIRTGERIFDEVLSDRGRRAAVYTWARTHPHTGSRAVYGGRPGPTIRDAWPLSRIRVLAPGLHAEAEPDPHWP